MSGQRVLIGMSGGVDSSTAAILLQQQGFEPVGCTLVLHGEAGADALDAAAVCKRLGIEHHILDFKNDFKDIVISNFINEYLSGRTPNPCVVCNKTIKFKKMLEAADNLDCEKIATGHYSLIKQQNGRFLIFKPQDLSKDQTYVLYRLTQQQLSRTLFPLSEISKETARQIAQDYGLINAQKKDSQDICFVPDNDYAAFIEAQTGVKSPEGCFTDINGNVLGSHKGIIRYTIGQRKGLGIALGKPAFVLEKNTETNSVVLDTDESKLFYSRVLVEDTNFLPFDTLCEPLRVTAKLRYRHSAQPATLHPLKNGRLLIEFDQPQRAPSAGQSAVFYDGDCLIGGGIIVKGMNDDEYTD